MKRLVDRAAEIKQLVRDEPGVRACDLAERTGVSRATMTLVIKALKSAEEVEQVRHTSGRGYGLRPTYKETKRRLLRERWGK